jgi:DNA-binding transcriptional LysR family regulator
MTPTDLSALSPAMLATFLEVAEAGGVLPASRNLHLSQPAVTARILQIERALGAQLFLRSARGMELTEPGRRLRVHARRIRHLLDEAARDVGSAVPDGERLSLAVSMTVAAHVLPPLLARFNERRGLAGIDVSVGNTEQVLEQVRDGLVPLGIVEGRGKAQAVRLAPLLVDEILPVYAPGSANAALIARVGRVRSAADLAALPIVWRESGSGTRKVVEDALLGAGIGRTELRPRFVLGENEAIRSAVLAGLGIGFISRCAIEPELASGVLRAIPVRDFRITRTFRWALPGGGLSGTAAEFHAFAVRELR